MGAGWKDRGAARWAVQLQFGIPHPVSFLMHPHASTCHPVCIPFHRTKQKAQLGSIGSNPWSSTGQSIAGEEVPQGKGEVPQGKGEVPHS